MGRRFYHAKDKNHDAVVAEILARGHGWADCSQSNLGFDGLVLAYGRLIPAEIKDPTSSRGLKLTPKEAQVHQRFLAHGVRIEILTCAADVDVLGRQARNMYDET